MTQAATQQTEPLIFAQMTKVDIAKRLVYGRAAQEVVDRVGEVFDYEASKPFFKAWSDSQKKASLGKSSGNVREMHKDIAAGILTPGTGITFNDEERAIDVCAHVTDDATWLKCESGTLTGFSIGGRYAKKWQGEDGKTHYAGDPSEVSLVDRPCIPTATFFEVQKADGTTEKRNFVPVDMTLFAGDKDLGIVVKSDALPEPGHEFEHEGQTYMLHKIEDHKATVEVIYSVTGTPEELGAFAKIVAERGITIAAVTELIAKSAPAKVEEIPTLDPADVLARAAQIAHDDEKVDFKKLDEAARKPWLEKATADMTAEALAKVAKVDPPPAGEQKYGSVAFADEANKKYPIDTEAHVRAALSYWGMAKNRSKYSAQDQKTISDKIHAAATKLGISKDDAKKLEGSHETFRRNVAVTLAKAAGKEGDEVAIDEYLGSAVDAKKMDRVFLRKGLITCASFAYALNALCQIAESCEMEAAQEGDGSDICNRIYALIAELGEALKDMVDEEIKEEVNGDEQAGPDPQAMAMSSALDGLAKRMEPLLKALGKEHVQKLHDRTATMGAMCKSIPNRGGPVDEVEARNRAVTMLAASEAVGALRKLNPALTEEAAHTLIKSMMPAEETVILAADTTELQKTVKDLTDRLAKVEKQPAPARIQMRVVQPVSKENDGGGNADPIMTKAAEIAASVEPILKRDGTVDEVATATKIMQKMGGAKVMSNGPSR